MEQQITLEFLVAKLEIETNLEWVDIPSET
jgi:hypothetical protein